MPHTLFFHNKIHAIPELIISPQSTEGLAYLLRLMIEEELYTRCRVSVKSGGHSYFADSACDGIVINLSRFNRFFFMHDQNSLFVEPGVALGNVVYALQSEKKVVPHGDCASVCAGGHWSTAGWDILLSRTYGLGSQNVKSAKIVLWDGTILNVSNKEHPELLWAIKGAGAAEVGIVTRFEMQTFDEPKKALLCRVPLSKENLECVVNANFAAIGYSLPNELSMVVDFVFDSTGEELLCVIEIYSLLNKADTLDTITRSCPAEFVDLVKKTGEWLGGQVFDIRIAPYNNFVQAHPEILAEMSGAGMTRNQETIWKQDHLDREMRHSYFEQRSYWLKKEKSSFLLDLWDFFSTIEGYELRKRSYGAVIIGGGAIIEQQAESSMPLGEVIVRFETHWDNDDPAERQRGAILSKNLVRLFNRISVVESALTEVISGKNHKSLKKINKEKLILSYVLYSIPITDALCVCTRKKKTNALRMNQ